MILAKYNLPALPIDDTQEPKDTSQSEDNKSRCKLASFFRLADVKGWAPTIYDHISFRCTQVPTQFYTNPFGLFFSEITASKILKLDFNGNIVQHGITDYGYNLPAFHLHSAIYQARQDINCIAVFHDPLIAGLSSTKRGFLPLTVSGLACSDISYLDFQGVLESSIGDNVSKALGNKNNILVMRNHGVVVCGSTVEETWLYLCQFQVACRALLTAYASAKDVDELIVLPSSDIMSRDKFGQCYLKMNAKPADNIVWKVGEIEYEAELRRLDRMGFKTGYAYKKKFHVSAITN